MHKKILVGSLPIHLSVKNSYLTKRAWYYLIILFYILILLQPTEVAMAAEMYTIEPEVFMNVPTVEAGKRHPASPQVNDRTWSGIAMTAPQKIMLTLPNGAKSLGQFAKLPICIYFRFKSGSVAMELALEPLIIVRNVKANQEYRGQVSPQDEARRSSPYAAVNGEPVVITV